MTKPKELNDSVHILENTLTDLIRSDYIFLDLPYYTNIGDTLIWKGTEDFLNSIPYKCIHRASERTYYRPNVSKGVTILIQGGGNFGDLWRTHTDFCLKIISDFPDNKIIILPKSIHYEDHNTMMSDATKMSKHQDLTICVRDANSLSILEKYFSKNNLLLLPDMAFCISDAHLSKFKTKEENKVLFFKRKDKELLSHCGFDSHIPKNETIDQAEWPSMDHNLFATRILNKLFRLHHICKRIRFGERLVAKMTNYYAVNIYMPYLVEIGIKFVSQYKHIYTTRLHGAILSVLLNKPVTLFDNSYGKNSSFYEAWLKGIDDITLIKNK